MDVICQDACMRVGNYRKISSCVNLFHNHTVDSPRMAHGQKTK